MIRGIDHIELIVRDVDEFVRFFEAMGFEVILRTEHHGGSAELKLPGEGQPVFEIHSVGGEEAIGVNHIAFKVDSASESYAELTAKGVKFAAEPHLVAASGRTIVNFRDPDGWRLQLVDSQRRTPEG
ncbi:MAG: VOC family protein [Chloroflexi bacterium]|nr:VOC family protein [Chloroflexota bacterium]